VIASPVCREGLDKIRNLRYTVSELKNHPPASLVVENGKAQSVTASGQEAEIFVGTAVTH
jgi:hypothetical protein